MSELDKVIPQTNSESTTTESNPSELEVSELDLLKQRATLLGVEFSNNIGLETLKQRVKEKQEQLENGSGSKDEPKKEVNALTGEAPSKKVKSLRQHMYDTQMKLVRIRIACLDPKKKDLPGEIISVANEYLGTVRKFVPYGERTDEGYHVPYCIYKMLNNRKFLQIRTRRDRKTGTEVISSNYVKEFSIEILPPLTPDEIKKLGTAQIAAGL